MLVVIAAAFLFVLLVWGPALPKISRPTMRYPAFTASWPRLEEAVTVSQPRGKKVFVLGKLAERRVEDGGGDIYVSIKSTAKNHKKRVAYSMLTWLQTVKPEQVSEHVATVFRISLLSCGGILP